MQRWTRAVLAITIVTTALTGACAEAPEVKRTRHVTRGDDYFGQKRYREALIEYQNVLRFDANDPHAIERMGLSYHYLGDFRHAFPFLKKARQTNPDDVGLTIKLAAIYLVSGRLDDARELASAVLEKDPDNLEALQIMGVSARSKVEIQDAERSFQTARPALNTRAGFHISLAELSMKSRDFDKAERQLKDALERDSRSVQAHLMLAGLYRAKGDRPGTQRELMTAVDIDPVEGGARLRLADFYAGTNQYSSSREVLSSAKDGDADYLTARRRLSEIAFIEGNTDESLAILDEIFKKAPSDIEGRLIRGRIYLTKQQMTEAIQDFQTALKGDSKAVAARYWLAVAYQRSGNIQQAKTELTQALQAAPQYVDAALFLAQLNADGGNAASTIEAMEKLIAEHPKVAQAYVLLGSAQLNKRKPADALQTFRKMEAIAPKDARAVYLAGIALQTLGQKAEASREFERALAIRPGFIDPLNALVAQAIADNQPAAALERVRKQMAVAGSSARLQFLLGSIHQVRKDTAAADAAFTKALETDRAFVPAYVALGQLYLRGKDDTRALARFEQALAVNPKDVVSRMMAAEIHLHRGDLAKARAGYEHILTAHPRFSPAANNLAWILTQTGGDKERALQLAQIAKEGAPDDPYVSDTLGWILHQRGVNERAFGLLKDSAAKLPANGEVQYHAGVVARALGQVEVARDYLQRATAADSEFPGKPDARKALAELR